MFPDLISIGPFTLHSYGLLVATGFLAALFVTLKIGKREGYTSQQIMDMGFLMILGGVIGSRILYILINFGYYLEHPLDAVKIWQGGLVFSGGILGALITVGWYSRRHHIPLWNLGDLWAPAASIGQGFGRIGCLLAGCCYGKPTDSWCGIVFSHPHSLAPLGIPLHPTQLYASLSAFAIFAILLVLSFRKTYPGQIFLWFLILHSTARLWIEKYRWDDRGSLGGTSMTVTQLVALGILLAAIVLLFVLKSRRRHMENTAGRHPPGVD